MLVLKRKEGQWVELHHHSGDLLRFRVYGICSGNPGFLNIAFDDDDRNFEIRRPERRPKVEPMTELMAAVVADVPQVLEVEVS
ncbi:hypothetical protein BH23PLA1_BH23PLA1_14310 [soil metagenome]